MLEMTRALISSVAGIASLAGVLVFCLYAYAIIGTELFAVGAQLVWMFFSAPRKSC